MYVLRGRQDEGHPLVDSTWNVISQQLEVDKIYLETHRDLLIVDDATLEQAKKFSMTGE